jgi:dihydrofolate reductase
MKIIQVVAASENNVIGVQNQLPWHLPDDLKFFKKTTTGKPVIMGRKTYESLGKPLPNRINIVLSAQPELQLPEGVLHFHAINGALEVLRDAGHETVCIIGGGQIFQETIGITDTVYLTRVHTHIDNGEAFFPHIDHSHFVLAWEEHHPADEKHAFSFTFQRFERTGL